MVTNFDYTSLLPGKLESTLQTLTKIYQDNSNHLNNAYLHTVLPGVYTSTPNIVHAKDIQFQVAFRSFPSIRNFTSYADLIDSLIPAIPDRDTLVSILHPTASGWQKLDVSDITALKKEYRNVFQSYLPKLDTIMADLQQFHDELVKIDKSNPPSWFHQTLFDTLRPILSFASFRDGVVGESSLAGVLDISLKMTSTPLNQVLFPFFPTSPDPKTVIAEAVQVHLVDAIKEYSKTLKSLIPLFTTFSETYLVLSEEQAAIVPRMIDDCPGTKPTTGDQCMTAWKAVKIAGTNFINLLSGGGVVTGVKASLRKTAGDVTAAFGPPYDASKTLPGMSTTTGQIVENFNKILSLPFIDTLKVTNNIGEEISVEYVMINCKGQYESLQSTTVEVARELNTYSILQDIILPAVNAKDGLTLEQFLLTNLPLVVKYGQNAKKIAADTQALLTKFEEWLAVLIKNLDEINKSIETNKGALDEAQKAYDSAKARSILDAILGLAFTAAALAALAFGLGPLAAGFGMTAGANFSQMIYDAVNAGKLSLVIGNLKSIISTSESTRSQLEAIIPLFRTIISLMGTIHTVWERISDKLTDVQANYHMWDNPAYFTPEMIKGALSNWKEVNTQCELYISIVAGQHPSFVKALTSTDTSCALSKDGEEPPPPYEVAVLPGHESVLGKILNPAERAGIFKAMAQASNINSLTAALSPPSLALGANRAELNDAANSYRQISALLNGIYNDSSSDAARLASTITSSLIPSLNKAIEFYIKFSDGQEDPFAKGTSPSAMERSIAERWKELKEGSNLAKAAETVFLNFRFDSQAALNTLTRHVKELYQQLASKEASLRELQADYDKWSWVLYWPFPPGVGAIIYLIIDSIKQTRQELNKLRNDINKLNNTRVYVSRVQKMSDDVGRITSSLSRSWSELTTKTNNLQTLVYAVVINSAVEKAIKPVVQANWKAFSIGLKQW